jgi:hypothetical protein
MCLKIPQHFNETLKKLEENNAKFDYKTALTSLLASSKTVQEIDKFLNYSPKNVIKTYTEMIKDESRAEKSDALNRYNKTLKCLEESLKEC